MKKLITLTFALLFSAGMAFGQNNDATSTQTGNNNDVTVNQVYEAGGSNHVNHAFTLQDGDFNKIKRLHQVGAGNDFEISQNGDHNVVSEHPDQGDAQGGAPSFDGIIHIHQSGDYNEVWDADQVGYGNVMHIIQGGEYGEPTGNNNVVNVEAQVNMDQGSDPNTIAIHQFGDNNVVGGYGDNEPGAYQEGSGNSMDITQNGDAKAGVDKYMPDGSGQYSYTETQFRSIQEHGQGLIQLGKNNKMMIDQTGPSTISYLYQNGENNMFDVTQNGAGNTAKGTQIGNGNTSTITQN